MLPVLAVACFEALISSMIAGYVLTKLKGEKKFRKMLIFLTSSNLILWLLFTASFYTENQFLIAITVLMSLMFNFPIISITAEMACNTCFPMGEGLVTGV